MKSIFTFFLLTVGFLFLRVESAKAQTPTFQFLSAGDSSWTSNCSLPDTVSFFAYGTTSGFGYLDTVTMMVNFGDGHDTTVYTIIDTNWFGGSSYFVFNLDHLFLLPGAYTIQFIATAPNGMSDTLTDFVLAATTCGDITGNIYLDANGNCLNNPGELPLKTLIGASYNGSNVAMTSTDSLGNYVLNVPAGFTYTVAPLTSNYNVACPMAGSYSVSTLPSTGNDFAIVCAPSFDLKAHISGQGFRANTNTSVFIDAHNLDLSCVAPTATVTVTLDPKLSYTSSSIIPISVTSSQVIFNAGQLTGLNYTEFYTSLTLLTDPSAVIGDTLCLTVSIDPIAGDADPSNNVSTVCMPVRNSCDPNEKYESHAGATSATVAPGTKLDYTIMFQNIGNDDAYDISIIDELNSNLDLSTLEINSFSHKPAVYLIGNTLKFEFKNINLPGALINEPMSHGFVSFSVYPKSTTPLGTSITNKADIYFDFNGAIVTNTVTDVVDNITGLTTVSLTSVSLYPNPAHDYVLIHTGIAIPSQCTILDPTGRSILGTFMVGDGQRIQLDKFKPGIYYIQLVTNGVTRSEKLFVE